MNAPRPVVVTVAGSDPAGAAGLELDLRVLHAMGVHGMAVATALTEQDTKRVHAVHPVAPDVFQRRLRTLLADVRPLAFKVGMLASAEIAESLAEILEEHPSIRVVLDPVLVSTSGHRLLDDPGRDVLLHRLIPRSEIVTPNLSEAAALLSSEVADAASLARELARRGPRAVVVTGGDVASELARDVVAFADGREYELAAPRIGQRSPRGTGCGFSSAVAAGLALGFDVATALGNAKLLVTRAIAVAYRVSASGALILDFEREGVGDEHD